MIAVATMALVWAGALHWILGVIFCVSLVFSWRLEGTNWQLSERTGLILVLLSIPLFYLDWTYLGVLSSIPSEHDTTKALVGAIAHLIVVLSGIKLFQTKGDRDWVFLYLISFFEILLAAGLSFSPIFLASLTVYLVCALSTVIAFEIRKARRGLQKVETRLLVSRDALLLSKLGRLKNGPRNTEVKRLPVISVALLLLIAVLALPLFLVAPRAGSAAFTRNGGGLSSFIGFSENVQLGEIGTLKGNDQVVMHVRLEDTSGYQPRELRWRGVALDEFTGRAWKKSIETRRSERRVDERCTTGTGCGVYPLDTAASLHRLMTQTIFLEPLDTPVIFAAPRAVAVQGPFPFLRQDAEGSLQSRHHEFERFIYRAVSDPTTPDPNVLRQDMRPFSSAFDRYVRLPDDLDPRIRGLARTMILNAQAHNFYDAARAIETGLRTQYGYSLQMRAGGADPLADFLFNVRSGHCEYFSTAMVVMLRSQGIPSRVVNGFLSGEYNEAAGAYTVRQSDAHSWVEVYFPETNSWVTFDPTPAAGRAVAQHAGLSGLLGKYAEAFELMWFQYVIGYDKQEQRSLATSLNNRLFRYRRDVADELFAVSKMPAINSRHVAILSVSTIVLVLSIVLIRRIARFGWRRAFIPGASKATAASSSVEFYERLTRLLAARELKREPHQTPLEFAVASGYGSVASITKAYNRVRFGGEALSAFEVAQIGEWLNQLEREDS